MNKKLQVFVSSTYTDLKEERQAAVEAILDAGHIPAGMELFKAGNESQLKTIYKWIDESDVYMLILGGRYGSVESKSGKSYTQLEYEYAISKRIPVFAVVLSESFLTNKVNTLGLTNTMEQKAPDKYQSFKEFVMSKIIREVDDCKDIIIQVHATLNEFMREYDLTGWIRNSNENDTLQLLKDNNELLKENNSLNKQIQELQERLNAKSKEQFGKYSFDDLLNILKNQSYEEESVLDFFISNYSSFAAMSGGRKRIFYSGYSKPLRFLEAYDLISEDKGIVSATGGTSFSITKSGTLFYVMLESNNMVNNSI
ncbi:MAG: DUF4062 domain-containing protein [Lachnospiraceae bacterium]|nr:DUF4062 domain-containing protein [Lachnospiraceae bacterium]